MINKDIIRKDLWDEIEIHYLKECYTDAVKDSCLYLLEQIRIKSEIEDKDGEKLINDVFSEKNPKLLINNNQTESEKDEQRGIGFIIRGIICAIRNPISHNNDFKYTKEQCEGIILFINNYILQKIDDSKDFGYVDNWFEYIFINNSDDETRYCDILLENIPKKERLPLLLEIIDKIEMIEDDKYTYFINKLMEALTIKERTEIIIALNKILINNNNERKLCSIFNHFKSEIWNKLDKLARVKIENKLYKEFKNIKLETEPFTDEMYNISDDGLIYYMLPWIEELSNKNEIYDLFFKYLSMSDDMGDYISKYYYKIVKYMDLDDKKIQLIKDNLEKGNPHYKKVIDNAIIHCGCKELKTIFDNEYETFKKSNDYLDLPF